MNPYKSRKLKLNCFFLTLSIFSFFNIVSAQPSEPNADTKQILFNVTVGTDNGFITGLRPEHFTVYDQDKLQTITKFSNKDIPLSVGILYDVSESPKAKNKIVDVNKVNPIILRGLKRFVELSNQNNEYFFLSFNQTTNLLADYTQSSETIIKTIEQAEKIKAKGSSNLNDAIGEGIDKVSKGKNFKRVLIVISDGLDGDSKIKTDELEKKLKGSDVLLIAYGVYKAADGNARFLLRESRLDELTEQTGGYFYYENWTPMNKGSDEKRARGVFSSIANELRSQYIIGFDVRGSDNQKTDFWHDIKVKVKLPAGIKGIENDFVRTRKGYYSNFK